MMTLNDKQIEFYRQVGYLVVPNLLAKTEIGTFLRYEAQQNKQRLGYQTHLVDPQWAYLAHHPKVSSLCSSTASQSANDCTDDVSAQAAIGYA